MAQFVKKILCPSHEEANPSCALYSDGSGWCFTCQKYFKDLAEPVEVKKLPENVQERITYIDSLPTQVIRGLELPFDNIGYYIVWPTGDYYKCRRWLTDDAKGKYINPSGVKQPWLVCRISDTSKSLVIVEGELNALSLAQVYSGDVMSPGGVSQFSLKGFGFSLTHFKKYETINIIADNQPVGAQALLKLKKEFAAFIHPNVRLHLVDTDFNEQLVEYGKEEFQKRINKMGL